LLTALIPLLAACGVGGDGPPSGAVTTFEDKLSDVAQPVSVRPRYAHLQFGGGTAAQSSGPNAPGAEMQLDIDPTAGTITFDTVNILPQTLPIDFDDDSQTIAFAADPNHWVEMLIPGQASGYEYTSYGAWAWFVRGTPLSFAAFVSDAFYFGTPTGGAQMPDGSATFEGTMRGFHTAPGGNASLLRGDATLNANFDAHTVTGSFHDISDVPVVGAPLAGFSDISVDAQISGGAFTGRVIGSGAIGTLRGDFFGPGAAEMGGVFSMTGLDGGKTIGAFAAKQ
jgi:hypothetical protein